MLWLNGEEADPAWKFVLAHLTQLTLQGSEDAEAFSVAALTRLLQVQTNLETLSCQYIDLVASTSQSQDQDQLTLFTKALEQSTRLQKVQMTSLRLVVANNNTPHTTLDPIIQGLGHCQHVELAMRHRSTISKQALEAMLLTTTSNSNLQSLVLGRRISLTTQELDTILRCQQELQTE
ncbi:expressed unknown protein [Seminavis robusta]|uniref:Uncharacterized protein n=1 Tax=Seminavis robusta TaxID=568900 RepID=A0A9N8HSY1_9STRA|nr:expressed unknown protein [Seminavis robusta]|eukprot:Sro1585_g284070.1 n/a (178) ;mRNA; f:7815-8348